MTQHDDTSRPGSLAGPAQVLKRFHLAGASTGVIHSYMYHQWYDDEAVAWAAHGIEALDAYMWSDLGLTAHEAADITASGKTLNDVVREWWSAGIPYDEVADWLGAGLSVEEAVTQRSEGVQPRYARALRTLRATEFATASQVNRELLSIMRRYGPPTSERFGLPPSDLAEAESAVRTAFEQFLSTSAFVEDEASTPTALSGDVRAVVTRVLFVNASFARVLFDVTDWTRQLTWRNHVGRSTLQDGVWRVALTTFRQVHLLLAG